MTVQTEKVNLYVLKLGDGWDYDQIIEIAVLARSVWDARRLAREACRGGKVIDGKYVSGAGEIPAYADAYCNSALSTCEKIDQSEAQIVLRYMRHG